MDSLVFSKEAKYHTAGALFNGKRIWLLCKLPEQIVVMDDDTVDRYLLLVNAHDGTSSCKVMFTPIRVVCNNTLNLATSKAETKVNIAHTGDIEKKLNEARRILGIAINYFRNLEEAYKAFAAKALVETDLRKYVANVLPGETTRMHNIRQQVLNLHEIGAGSEIAHRTLWGAYNSITEFVDHHSINPGKYPDRYLNNILFRRGAEIKTKAFEEAVSLV